MLSVNSPLLYMYPSICVLSYGYLGTLQDIKSTAKAAWDPENTKKEVWSIRLLQIFLDFDNSSQDVTY